MKTTFVILVSLILTLFCGYMFGTYNGYNNGKELGIEYAYSCYEGGGIIQHDGISYYCLYE